MDDAEAARAAKLDRKRLRRKRRSRRVLTTHEWETVRVIGDIVHPKTTARAARPIFFLGPAYPIKWISS